MKNVGELMLPLDAFPYIPYWFSLRRALAELESAKREFDVPKTLPKIVLVFDAQNHILGVVQRQTIFRALQVNSSEKLQGLLPDYIMENPAFELNRLSFSQERALNELEVRMEQRVIDFMSPLQVTVNFNDHLLLSIHLMIEHYLTFLPVVKDSKIEGILDMESALNEVISNVISTELHS